MLKYLDAALAKQVDQVYALDAGDGDSAVHIRIARMLDVDGDRQAQRLRQSALARHVLTHALETSLGREQLQHYQLGALATGKPLLVSAHQAVMPAISFSHSGDFVACAWADRPAVGIDVERLLPRDWAAVQDIYLHPEEKAWMAEIPVEDQALHYYGLWCLKEAFYKCLPTEAELTMAEFCFSPDHMLKKAPAAFLPLARWNIHVDFLPAEGVVLAVVW